jgi:hypothetical protein
MTVLQGESGFVLSNFAAMLREGKGKIPHRIKYRSLTVAALNLPDKPAGFRIRINEPLRL